MKQKLAILTGVFMLLTYLVNAQDELVTWNAPSGTASNSTFSVQVRKTGDSNWTDLFEYNVKVGHQDGSFNNSSMVNFDFSGTVDVKIIYNGGAINSFDIRPLSYEINAMQDGNTLTFSVTQDYISPRKIVVRINNSWETEVLHLLTNVPEISVPEDNAANVLAINPGDPIPFRLPAGKDTYYFKSGVHTLPTGLWLELDLGASYALNRFELYQGTYNSMVDKVKFIIEGKENLNDDYSTLYNGTGNTVVGTVSGSFTTTNTRYVRLKLLGNNASGNYIFASLINEFKIFASGNNTNLALNKAIAGAMVGYENAVDGDISSPYRSSSGYGNWHAGESFFINKSSTTVYIEKGAVVKGAIISDGINQVTISGHGILDCSGLIHTAELREGRTGAIWLTSGTNNLVEGITILDPPMWGVVMNFSESPKVLGINMIGHVVNADGIHFSGSNSGIVDGVFIRTCDDNLVMYHFAQATGNIFENSVFWGDDAHIALIGLAGNGGGQPISNLTFQNLDILNQQGVYDLDKFNGCLKLWPNGENTISNVVFDNIRIDPFRGPENSAIFQFRTDERFSGEGSGSIKDISLINVNYRGSGERESLLKGTGNSNNIDGIRFINYFRNNNYAIDESSANIEMHTYVTNVSYMFDGDSERRNIALHKTSYSDQLMFSGHGTDKAVDGTDSGYAQARNRETPWKLTIDLGKTTSFNRIVYRSGNSEYASDYLIQGSADGSSWSTIVEENGSSGGTKTYDDFGEVSYRFVRLNPTKCDLSPGDWGYTVLDFEIYNDSLTSSSHIIPNDMEKIKVYPNPTNGELHVSSINDSSLLDFQLFSLNGVLVREGELYSGRAILNTRDIKPGTYILYLQKENRLKSKFEIVKI